MDIQDVKRQFKIIGNNPLLNRAIEIAIQVAATDLTVFINGESGTGKEVFPQIIHKNSSRKFGRYIAVNCGAIPEGTIDSELFGHEKGSFTGAIDTRKGYFEEADGGTLFLDEVAELPLPTQARLLRVLENGEFMKVGSSKVQKTNVRVVAATNVNIPDAIEKNKFREDLYYRLNTVPIYIPPLRNRKEDIALLFRKFATDFSDQYHMPAIQLTPEAIVMLENYHWDGNVRQLKNVTEQISIIEKERLIDDAILSNYLPIHTNSVLPILYKGSEDEHISERDLLYKVLFEMKKDINDLKQTVAELSSQEEGGAPIRHIDVTQLIHVDDNKKAAFQEDAEIVIPAEHQVASEKEEFSLEKTEIEMISKALEKYDGNRKEAAQELGISERTLYRKIKKYGIDL